MFDYSDIPVENYVSIADVHTHPSNKPYSHLPTMTNIYGDAVDVCIVVCPITKKSSITIRHDNTLKIMDRIGQMFGNIQEDERIEFWLHFLSVMNKSGLIEIYEYNI